MSKRITFLLVGAALLSSLALVFFDGSDEPPRQSAPAKLPPAVPQNDELAIPQAPQAASETAPTEVSPPPPTTGKAPAETVEVSGWIGDASGNGLGDIGIEIESHGFDGEEIVAFTTRSDQRGEFRFAQLVPARQYRLEIKPQRGYAGFRIDSFSPETAEALRRILLEGIDLVDADGMIVDTAGAPVSDFELSVRSLWVDFPDRGIKSDASGYFRLEAFPAGAVSIATNASDYYRIEGLELRPDEYRNLTLIIDRGGYHLGGLLRDINGAPVEQAQVTLKSAFKTDEYHSYSYRSAVSDSGGAFEFSGLGGSRLTLGIYAAGFETHVQRHDFVSFSDRVEIVLQPES